ncbi:uncharacterized protein FIBRA_08813 [Fibroporia radiculosa]|uniref:G-protein coupled receptors family 1 profile domain-containing protein n=1 Tax=Fibroporia radiculosa TaxID=599839 RepID=J4H5D3_9APHY|nr:uncharacterized protein FIBRA_08813 [Fibroporia radiculosa]CCM06539.1 predicted protein [Fibroporia radiculosa]
MSSPWATDEPQAELWLEQSINAGTYIGAAAYGLHVALYITCLRSLSLRRQHYWYMLTFVTVLLSLGTINIVCNIRFNEFTWIDYRNYPGGPFAYIMGQETNPLNIAGNAASIIATFLADGLLLYRTYILWNNNWMLIVIPILMYLASTVLSAFFVYQAARPDSSLWAQNSFNFGLAYWALTMSLNIILTLMLVVRLFIIRRQVKSTLGADHARTYSDIAAMIMECALPYGVISFIFIVLYGIQNTGENLFIPLLAQVQCITPELIILRVAKGHAWTGTKNMSGPVSAMSFTDPKTTMTTSSDTTTREANLNDISITFSDGSSSQLERKNHPSDPAVSFA